MNLDYVYIQFTYPSHTEDVILVRESTVVTNRIMRHEELWTSGGMSSVVTHVHQVTFV